MRVVRLIVTMAITATIGIPGLASGQSLLTSHSFAGGAAITVSRPGSFPNQQVVTINAGFSPGVAQFSVTPPSGSPFLAAYSFLELPAGTSSVSLLWRNAASGADAALPGVLLMFAQASPNAISLFGFGATSGTDGIGPFSGILVMQLNATSTLPPQPPPPNPDPTPTLPSFDGATLRVPAVWNVRKFEGWAMRLAQKYGTLSGGTSAAVPAAWQNGVMQVHCTGGFIYEIPLNTTYAGFINGMILYTPPGQWPSWEGQARWQQIAATSQVTKYVYR